MGFGRLRGADGDERVVLDEILEASVFAEMDGIQLA